MARQKKSQLHKRQQVLRVFLMVSCFQVTTWNTKNKKKIWKKNQPNECVWLNYEWFFFLFALLHLPPSCLFDCNFNWDSFMNHDKLSIFFLKSYFFPNSEIGKSFTVWSRLSDFCRILRWTAVKIDLLFLK